MMNFLLSGPQPPTFKDAKVMEIKKRKLDECDFDMNEEERELNLIYFETSNEESDTDDSLYEP